MAEVVIAGKTYALVADSLLPTGKRAIQRSYRPTNTTDPGRIKRVQYEVSGPIGASQESTAGYLGIDYVTGRDAGTGGLETRYPRRLLSQGKRNVVDITGSPVTDSGGYAEFAYGSPSSAYGGTEALFGTSDASGDIVNFMDEQEGRLFLHHGAISTQVNLDGMAEEENFIHANIVMHAIDWRLRGYVGFGPGKAVAYRTNVTDTGSTYTDVGGVTGQYARKFAVGSDRLWVATGVNQATFTNNDYTTFATAFEIGDHKHLTNGVGTLGPYTFFGKQGGVYSFTDVGKPVPMSDAFTRHLSTLNGAQMVAFAGWLYYTSALGLRALNASLVDNAVGIGVALPNFTGHGGIPTALWTADGDLFVAYLVDETNTYIYRGQFNPQKTPGTGQLDWFPFRYLASTQCNVGYSSSTTDNPVIIWGEDGDFAYEEFDPLGRDDLWDDRLYSTLGGVAYLTTLDRDPHMLKALRLVRVRVLNVEYCATWRVAVAFDVEPWNTPTYYDVGPELDVPGYHTLRPTMGRAPIQKVAGRNMKFRLTQTAEGANSETLPPEINGPVEIEYDERPANIEEVALVLQAGTDADRLVAELRDLASEQTEGPSVIRLPGDRANERRYAMVADVQRRTDLKGDGIEGVTVTLHLWDVE